MERLIGFRDETIYWDAVAEVMVYHSDFEAARQPGKAEALLGQMAGLVSFSTRMQQVTLTGDKSPAYKQTREEKNMGKLRHIAFISKEPKKLSDFYQKHFGFEECKVFPSGSRMVIDPLFNLAFLQSRGDQAGPVVGTHRADGAELERQAGIHHYGFLVDDLKEAVAKLPASLNRGASPQVSAGVGGPEGARPAEIRFIDPWGNNVDLSARGFLGREEKKLPGVRLLAVQVPDLPAACEFYQQQFDLKMAGWTDDGTIRLSDGTVTLLLTKTQLRPKSGVQYFGIQVSDLPAVKQRLQTDGVAISENAADQIEFNDPEGNRVVVSGHGWN